MDGWGRRFVHIAPDGTVLPCHAASILPGHDFVKVSDVPLRDQWDGGAGCRFRFRCPARQERCDSESPTLREIAPNHRVACHFPLRDGALS